MADTLTNIVRNEAWVEREYNQDKWPLIEKKIRECISNGETDLSRVLHIVEDYRRDSLPWVLPDNKPHKVISCGQKTELPFFMVFEGFYALIAKLVTNACRENTSAIVELGSGTGHNLCRAWLRGASSQLKYIAMEFTASGRRCSQLYSQLAPDFDLNTHYFNFNAPDFSNIPQNSSHIVIFTAQSIEQIPNIKLDMFTKLLATIPRITCIHFEPIAWQVERYNKGSSAITEVVYAQQHDYNRNLYPILKQLETQKKIVISETQLDLFGVVPANSISYLRWDSCWN